jgi:membrane protein implicated in regulation of membrane protease activity
MQILALRWYSDDVEFKSWWFTISTTKSKSPLDSARSVRIKNFFSIARFGPDSIFLISAFAVATVLLFEFGLRYAALVTLAAVFAVFGLESAEMIQLDKVRERNLVGVDCLVTKKISKGERGFVKVYDQEAGRFGSEIWSAESSTLLEEGSIARVVGVKSIILRVVSRE